MQDLTVIISFSVLLGLAQQVVAQESTPSAQETADYIVYGLARNSVLNFRYAKYVISKAPAGDGDLSAKDNPSNWRRQISIGATGGGCTMKVRWSYNNLDNDKNDVFLRQWIFRPLKRRKLLMILHL